MYTLIFGHVVFTNREGAEQLPQQFTRHLHMQCKVHIIRCLYMVSRRCYLKYASV